MLFKNFIHWLLFVVPTRSHPIVSRTKCGPLIFLFCMQSFSFHFFSLFSSSFFSLLFFPFPLLCFISFACHVSVHESGFSVFDYLQHQARSLTPTSALTFVSFIIQVWTSRVRLSSGCGYTAPRMHPPIDA